MKKFLFIFILIAFIPLFFVCCGEEERISAYSLDIVYNNKTRSMNVFQQVEYVNNSDNSFKELYFHLYPNAFREDANKKPVSLANYSLAYPNGASYGGIEISKVCVEGQEVEFKIEGDDKNILALPLNKELFPNESVFLQMEYTVTLPNVNHRFGYGENTINIANFYPIACVYEDGVGFHKELYTSNGDPFYSDISNYNVTIEYDNNLKLASSGNVIDLTENEGQKFAKIEGRKIRDFAIVLSDKFNKISQEVDGITLNYYFYNDETAEDTLEMSAKALSFYDDKFGSYPYSQLSVVQNNFVYGGMEYPNLVMISDTLSTKTAYYVIAHEIAHQWWYGVVGNDEYNEAWVDEALTEYSTVLFFENHGEYELEYDTLVTNANSTFNFYYDIYESVCNEVDTSMARALNEFETEPEYVHSVYTQGVIMYDSLRELIGENKFYKCCQSYYKKMAYKNASGAELIAIFSNASMRNLESFFNSFLNGEVVIG